MAMSEQIAQHTPQVRATTPETDAWWLEPEKEEMVLSEFSGCEIYEALGSGKLSADQAFFLHNQGMNWEIKVGGAE